MATDYISREAVIKYLEDCSGGYNYIETETKGAIDDIKAIPAADVRPVVRARWYWDAFRGDWCCGSCYHSADHYIDEENVFKKPSFNFCPHCGADMREG